MAELRPLDTRICYVYMDKTPEPSEFHTCPDFDIASEFAQNLSERNPGKAVELLITQAVYLTIAEETIYISNDQYKVDE